MSLDPAKNHTRFYRLSWQVSLEDDTALVCTWGRLSTQGRTRVICFLKKRSKAERKRERLIQRRFHRGYAVAASALARQGL